LGIKKEEIMSEITQENVAQALGNMSVMQIITLTKELEQLWGVEAKPAVVQQTITQPETQAVVQSEFSVILNSVPADKKISVIKMIREVLGLTLLDSKAVLDTLPKMVKDGLSKEDADQLKTKLTEAGAIVEVK
jgi:large subunit ribosomal protein L7/L12